MKKHTCYFWYQIQNKLSNIAPNNCLCDNWSILRKYLQRLPLICQASSALGLQLVLNAFLDHVPKDNNSAFGGLLWLPFYLFDSKTNTRGINKAMQEARNFRSTFRPNPKFFVSKSHSERNVNPQPSERLARRNLTCQPFFRRLGFRHAFCCLLYSFVFCWNF